MFFGRGMKTSRCKPSSQGFSLACFLVDCAGFTDLKTEQQSTMSQWLQSPDLDLRRSESVKDTTKVCVSNWNIGHKYYTDILFEILFWSSCLGFARKEQSSLLFFLTFICNLQWYYNPVYNSNLGKHVIVNSKAVFCVDKLEQVVKVTIFLCSRIRKSHIKL